MAFDRPLEADRVDDLNLFGTFIRAPIIGTLLWIVGGKEAQADEEEQKLATVDGTMTPPNQFYSSHGRRLKSSLKKGTPNLVGSDLSDVGACSEALDGMHLVDSSPPGTLKKRKKQLSWSDESGQSLVEVLDNHEVSVRTRFVGRWWYLP